LTSFVDVRQILITHTIVITNPDRKRVAQCPLHLAAVNADCDAWKRRGVNELGGEAVDLACTLGI
jgi:hypothetical protein